MIKRNRKKLTAIEWFKTRSAVMPESETKEMFRMAISALKKQKTDRWIPVTERLPEVKQRVLVQRKDGFMEVKICIDGGHLAWFYSGIVAWRPLPELYTEEKE